MPNRVDDVFFIPSTEHESPLSFQLGFDEAALEIISTLNGFETVIRFWMFNQHAVVLGRSSPTLKEVNTLFCRENAVEFRRRCSGGQTVVIGPGCLMYAVVLRYDVYPALRMLDRAHRFVMSRMKEAIASIGIDVEINGTSDLTLDGRKFSGNSLRCKKDAFVYHGTMICEGFDLSLVPKCLKRPIREPDYRQGRSHDEFLTHLPTDCETLRQAIIRRWGATEMVEQEIVDRLLDQARKLAAKKYETDEWTFKVP